MQYAALHGPKRRVLRVMHVSLADARRQGYQGPRFQLELECGHTVRRLLVRSASHVKCGLCLGPGFNAKGFRDDEATP